MFSGHKITFSHNSLDKEDFMSPLLVVEGKASPTISIANNSFTDCKAS